MEEEETEKDNKEETVLSEVHVGRRVADLADDEQQQRHKNPRQQQQQQPCTMIEVWSTELPPPHLDEDGDLVLPRCKRLRNGHEREQGEEEEEEEEEQYKQREKSRILLKLQHHMDTPLATVGLQLWSGAFLMLDYLVSITTTITNESKCSNNINDYKRMQTQVTPSIHNIYQRTDEPGLENYLILSWWLAICCSCTTHAHCKAARLWNLAVELAR